MMQRWIEAAHQGHNEGWLQAKKQGKAPHECLSVAIQTSLGAFLAAAAEDGVKLTPRGPNWQLIEDCPECKDGRPQLVWREDWGSPSMCRWELNRRTNTVFWNDWIEWDHYDNEENPPTHVLCMYPLPKPVAQP